MTPMSKALPLFFKEYGNPKHPAVMLLHGFLGNANDWISVAERFADAFHVVTPDLPGHGRSLLNDPDAIYDIPLTATSLLRLLTALDIHRCAVVGYSMGGRLALYMAITHPNRIRAAVIESGTPGIASESERAARRAHDAALALEFEKESLAEVLTRWYARPLFDSLRRRPRFEELLQTRLINDRLQVAQALVNLGAGSQPNLWPSLPDHTVPTLMLVGEHDARYIDIARAMTAQSPAIRMEIAPGAGHNIHFEVPEAFVQSVRAFLENVLRDRSAQPRLSRYNGMSDGTSGSLTCKRNQR